MATTRHAPGEDAAGEVVLGYGAAVRGRLKDSQGGPLRPPGVRMREAVQDVRDALDRHLHAHKGGLQSRCCTVWLAVWTVDARSHVRPWSTWADRPKTGKRSMPLGGRALR